MGISRLDTFRKTHTMTKIILLTIVTIAFSTVQSHAIGHDEEELHAIGQHGSEEHYHEDGRHGFEEHYHEAGTHGHSDTDNKNVNISKQEASSVLNASDHGVTLSEEEHHHQGTHGHDEVDEEDLHETGQHGDEEHYHEDGRHGH